MSPEDLTGLTDHPAWKLGNLLDVRPGSDFAAQHLAPAVSYPLDEHLSPASTQAEWQAWLPSIFLPPRHEPLVVLAPTVDVADLLHAQLRDRGRQRLTTRVVSPEQLARLPARMLARGHNRRHLWRPPAFLARWAHLLPPPAAGGVLDLGAGSGRAAVWLAEQGYRVTAVERDRDAIALGQRLADHSGVECQFRNIQLRSVDQLPPGPWAVVLAFRFLMRELLAALAQVLRPAGLVMIQTFRDGLGPKAGPRPRFRLRTGELMVLFPTPPFRVLVAEENLSSDGWPQAGLVARLSGRPPGPSQSSTG